jgi:hypothetical protein
MSELTTEFVLRHSERQEEGACGNPRPRREEILAETTERVGAVSFQRSVPLLRTPPNTSVRYVRTASAAGRDPLPKWLPSAVGVYAGGSTCMDSGDCPSSQNVK